jgi:phenylacetate-CoA ligase
LDGRTEVENMKKLLEYIRERVFWLADFLKGSPVASQLKDIRLILDDASGEEAQQRIDQHLSRLIDHAANHVKFYRRIGSVGDLTDFPIVNKQIIKTNREKFLSDDIALRKVTPVTTSGSTGTPFETFQDRIKRLRNTADTIYFARLAGFKIGQRLIYLKIWVQQKMQSRWRYRLQNIVPVDVVRLNDSQIALLLNKMNEDNSTIGILGYASALELISRYLDRHPEINVRKNVSSIIAMSETLNEYTRKTMERYFGVPVISRYSNLENGILAQQEKVGSGRYLVNTASYKLEILKMDRDEPAEEGETGRIVVTDLFNYAMPMIRYDTGDIGALVKTLSENSNKYLSVVEGRKLDLLYDTKGELVSSYVVYKNMWQYTEINQYQLIQEDAREYTFKINAEEDFQREEELISEFKEYLGEDAVFSVEYVSEIPLLASGKRKKIVNNYIRS